MAEHYRIGILTTRSYRPKDKVKLDVGVRIAQYYILGRLRHLTLFALAEIVPQLNGRVRRHIGMSRWRMFDTIEPWFRASRRNAAGWGSADRHGVSNVQ